MLFATCVDRLFVIADKVVERDSKFLFVSVASMAGREMLNDRLNLVPDISRVHENTFLPHENCKMLEIGALGFRSSPRWQSE